MMTTPGADTPDTKGMAKGSSRALWKGAITFGLVHIPIGLYSATAESELDFDWLDKRTMDPVGYKRVNKTTGKEIDRDNIVKGIEYHKGEYVVLSPEEIKDAYPRTTQTIEIEAFVDIEEVPFLYLERPYYTAPVNRGEKVYALLREALKETGKAGLAKVVIATKQHLAVLLPLGPALVLNLLRWGDEIRSWEDLQLPPAGKSAGIKDGEMRMAKQLIEEMSGHWRADQFRDEFREAVMKLVEAKAKAGETETVEPMEEALPEPGKDNVIDLTELLRRSLGGGAAKAAANDVDDEPAARKRSTPRKATGSATKTSSPRERAAASGEKKRKPAAKKSATTKISSRSTAKRGAR